MLYPCYAPTGRCLIVTFVLGLVVSLPASSQDPASSDYDERGMPGTQPIIDDLAPLYHVRPDALSILLNTIRSLEKAPVAVNMP